MKVIKKSANGKVELSFEDCPEIEFFEGSSFSGYSHSDLVESVKPEKNKEIFLNGLCTKIIHGDIKVNTEAFDENTQTYKIADIIKDRYLQYINQYNKIKRLETEPDVVEFEI